MEPAYAPTQTQRKATIGSNDATIMEKIGAAAPTAIERKWAGGEAEPTVLERQLAVAPPQKKSNTAMIAGIAAVVVILLGIGAFVMLNKQKANPVATNTVAPAGTQVTTTASSNQPPIPDGNGALLLSASPYADIDKIIDSKGSSVPLAEDDKSTPARLDLKPGNYMVTLKSPDGSLKQVPIAIEAGKRTAQHVNMTNVNVDDLAKEMNKP